MSRELGLDGGKIWNLLTPVPPVPKSSQPAMGIPPILYNRPVDAYSILKFLHPFPLRKNPENPRGNPFDGCEKAMALSGCNKSWALFNDFLSTEVRAVFFVAKYWGIRVVGGCSWVFGCC